MKFIVSACERRSAQPAFRPGHSPPECLWKSTATSRLPEGFPKTCCVSTTKLDARKEFRRSSVSYYICLFLQNKLSNFKIEQAHSKATQTQHLMVILSFNAFRPAGIRSESPEHQAALSYLSSSRIIICLSVLQLIQCAALCRSLRDYQLAFKKPPTGSHSCRKPSRVWYKASQKLKVATPLQTNCSYCYHERSCSSTAPHKHLARITARAAWSRWPDVLVLLLPTTWSWRVARCRRLVERHLPAVFLGLLLMILHLRYVGMAVAAAIWEMLKSSIAGYSSKCRWRSRQSGVLWSRFFLPPSEISTNKAPFAVIWLFIADQDTIAR